MNKWMKDVAIRTIKTMAQAAVGVIASSTLFSQVDWKVCVSTVILSGIVCILQNIAMYGER